MQKTSKRNHQESVLAHQLLAAARIVVEELTKAGYDDPHAAAEYKRLKALGFDDLAACRFITAIMTTRS